MPGNEQSKLKALSDIASINIDQDFDKILQNILEITCETMKAHSGTIMLVDETTGGLRMVASYGLGQDYPKRVHEAARDAGVPLTYSPSGIVLKAGKHYIVPNVFEEPRDKPWYNLTEELGFSSQIFTPMKIGPNVMGLLNVYMAQVHQFTDDEVNFVTIAASQASSVVQNARICGKLRTNITELNEYKEHLEDKVKNAYKELYESEAKYRELFENAGDAIFTCSVEGYITTANNATVRMSGLNTIDEVIGTHFSDWFPPESLQQALNNTRKYFSGEHVKQPVIYEFIRKNGEHRWAEIRSRVIREGYKAIGLHCIARDITEKMMLEEKLKESEALYKDLFENADDPMYTHDLKGNFLTVNKVGLKVLGGTEEEIIGSHISKWLTPESYKIFEDRVWKICLNQPLEQPIVIEVITGNGEHKWGEARTRLIRDGNRIIGTHGIVRDITEKIRLEKELRESEAKYKELFENAQDAIFVLDTEDNFLKMNQTGIRILGCTKEEVIGTHISKWLTQESLKIAKDRRKKWNSGEIVDKIDTLELVSKSGEHRWVETKTRHIKDGDRTIEIHGIARDITETKRLKNELKESNKQLQRLLYLIGGTRGGGTRASILKQLVGKPHNANQIAEALNIDYKTARHHLSVLVKNGIVAKGNNGYTVIYFISKNMQVNLNEFNRELEQHKS
jgi:PAS domain S-box-containing protein